MNIEQSATAEAACSLRFQCQAPESLEILKQVQDDVGGRMTGEEK